MKTSALNSLTATLISLTGVAQAETYSFSLFTAGVKAGTIEIAADNTGSVYHLKGKVEPHGMFKAVSKFRYNGSASGKIISAKLFPTRYSEKTVNDDRTSEVQMTFLSGRPKILSYTSNIEGGINPDSQIGALDLLSAAYTLFRDTAPEHLCNQTIRMFDGKRATRLVVDRPKGANPAICTGTYKRIAGFSPKSMQKGSDFPFSLTYTKLQNGKYRLQSFDAKTTIGSASARRD